jgi:uncharacterized membrane protein YuzA (DUF378 family)
MTALVLVLIGALNWGLVGLGGFLGMNLNVVNLLLGAWPEVEWGVYVLVGVAAIAKIIGSFMCPCSCNIDEMEMKKK